MPKCRVCKQNLTSERSLSRHTKICGLCVKKDVVKLPDGSEVRFCFEHRKLEPLCSFEGSKTRCINALNKLSEKRRRARMAKKQTEMQGESASQNTGAGTSSGTFSWEGPNDSEVASTAGRLENLASRMMQGGAGSPHLMLRMPSLPSSLFTQLPLARLASPQGNLPPRTFAQYPDGSFASQGVRGQGSFTGVPVAMRDDGSFTGVPGVVQDNGSFTGAQGVVEDFHNRQQLLTTRFRGEQGAAGQGAAEEYRDLDQQRFHGFQQFPRGGSWERR